MLRYLFAAVFTLLCAMTALPDLLFGLDQRSPWVQLVSFRPHLLVGLFGLTLLLGVITAFRRAVMPFTAGALAVLLVGVALVVPRLIPDPVPTTGRPLTIVAFNVYEGRADVNAIVAMVKGQQPDVVSLEEAGDRFRSRISPLVVPLGYHLFTTTGRGHPDVGGVTALVSNRLGDVEHRIGSETSAFPYIEITGGGLGSLRFVAFHSVAPVPGDVPGWREDLSLLSDWCAGSTPAIVAGDFNATLDHSALRNGMAGCSDAADQRGDGLIPTWGPNATVRGIGPQIDHVLATPGIEAESFAVGTLPGSDHWPIFATMRVPA